MPDVQHVIQAILKALNAGGHGGVKSGHPVVCISRDYGAGGEEVARILSGRLGLELFDQVILDKIATRINADRETMAAVESGASRVRDLWLYSLITGKDLKPDNYRDQLEKLILSLGRTGGVILGRGAHLILARSGALRVRITGSVERCARRVAEHEGVDQAEAMRRVTTTNQQRASWIADTFGASINDASAFDLIINTDHVPDTAKLVDLLVDAMHMVDVAGA